MSEYPAWLNRLIENWAAWDEEGLLEGIKHTLEVLPRPGLVRDADSDDVIEPEES